MTHFSFGITFVRSFGVLRDETKTETIITNKEGEAFTSKYPIRDYEKLILKEIETNEEYSLNNMPQVIELKEGENIIKVENEVKKGKIKVIKVDLDNNEIRIPNVEFDMDEITMIPKEKVTLTGEDLDIFNKLVTMLEDIEDVQHVYHNVEL